MTWVQLDFRPNRDAGPLPKGRPERVYVECETPEQAQLYMEHRLGKTEVPRSIHLCFDTLAEIVEWLAEHEDDKHGEAAEEGMDAWIANELAEGCWFVDAEEYARVMGATTKEKST